MMLQGMSAEEYGYWQAFFSIEPFPQQRQDRRVAEQLRVMLWAAGLKHLPRISELMPDWWGENDSRQSPEQIKAQMKFALAPRRRKTKHAA